jgi:SAM-dependent methyltransferase
MDRREYDAMRSVEDTHWWYRGLRRTVLRHLALLVPAQGRLRLLDAGCGTGGMLHEIERAGLAVDAVGIDFSEDAVRFTRERGIEGVARASVVDIPYADASFDVVVSLDVLCHANVGDDGRALGEFHRVLAPGGHLILNLPAFASLMSAHDEAVWTRRRYRRSELARMLKAAGFRPLRLTYRTSLLFIPAAIVRLLRRREVSRGAHAGSDVKAVHPLLNAMLDIALRVEEFLLRFTDLPVGLSVFAVARREGD